MKKNMVGERIKVLLKELNMSQSDLSRDTNINKATISQYISGKYYPTQNRLVDIATALHTTPAYLMGWCNDSNEFETNHDENPETVILRQNVDMFKALVYKRMKDYGVTRDCEMRVADGIRTLIKTRLGYPLHTAIETVVKAEGLDVLQSILDELLPEPTGDEQKRI